MSTPSPYAVPMSVLDGARIGVEEQVEEHTTAEAPVNAALWGGALQPAYGSSDGASGGGGAGCDGGCD